MKKGRDIEQDFRDVKYYNNSLYYKVSCRNSHVLIDGEGNIKKCLILDITKEVIYTRDGFLDMLKETAPEISNTDIVDDLLKSLKYKVYKKIKIKELK